MECARLMTSIAGQAASVLLAGGALGTVEGMLERLGGKHRFAVMPSMLSPKTFPSPTPPPRARPHPAAWSVTFVFSSVYPGMCPWERCVLLPGYRLYRYSFLPMQPVCGTDGRSRVSSVGARRTYNSSCSNSCRAVAHAAGAKNGLDLSPSHELFVSRCRCAFGLPRSPEPDVAQYQLHRVAARDASAPTPTRPPARVPPHATTRRCGVSLLVTTLKYRMFFR